MINTSNLEQAKKLMRNEKKPIIVKAQSYEFNRKILDYGKFDILLFPEEKTEKKDGLKQLDIAFNHVLAKIATKNDIAIGLDLEEIRPLNKKDKAQELARIIQIIKICRKARTSLILLNYRDKLDTLSLLISLGASTQQAKEVIR